MKKHLIIIIIALAFAFTAVGCKSDDLVYTKRYDESGRAYVSVSGGSKKDYTSVKLAETYDAAYVEVIDENAFSDCVNLVEVTVSQYIKQISHAAFKNCTSLPRITLPLSLQFIGPEAFRGCTALKGITIPDNVIDIGTQAFQGCTNLINVVMPAYIAGAKDENEEDKVFLEVIRERAFADCFALEYIPLPGGIKTISVSAFENCLSLSNITLPEGLMYIGNYAYAGCSSLEKIELPSNLENIGIYAFSDCSSLSEVVIKGSENPATEPEDTDGETNNKLIIGESAFANCDIKKLTILRAEIINFAAFNFSGDLTGLTIKVLSEVYNDYLSDSEWGTLADYISVVAE